VTKTIKTETLKLKLWEEVAANVTLLVSKNVICWFIDCNSVMSCVEGNTKV